MADENQGGSLGIWDAGAGATAQGSRHPRLPHLPKVPQAKPDPKRTARIGHGRPKFPKVPQAKPDPKHASQSKHGRLKFPKVPQMTRHSGK